MREENSRNIRHSSKTSLTQLKTEREREREKKQSFISITRKNDLFYSYKDKKFCCERKIL